MMRQSLLLIVASALLSNASLHYYITPEPDVTRNESTCMVNGSIAIGCYSLQQFIDNLTLLSNTTSDSLTLLLLSGTHLMPHTRDLIVSFIQIQRLQIRPWNEQQEVVIECHSQTDSYYNITDLELISIHFKSCVSQWSGHQVNIINCTFSEYDIELWGVANEHNKISVHNSTFISGTIYMWCLTGGHLYLSNTAFLNTRRGESVLVKDIMNVTLHRCKFMNNTGTSAARFYNSSVVLDNTEFLNNRVRCTVYESSDFNINCCLFRNNSGQIGGAIHAFGQKSAVISNTIFQENHAVSGGAISSTQNLHIHSSLFENNSASQNGGAVKSHSRSQLSNVTFKGNTAKHGGAVYGYFANVSNCQFLRNLASRDGGALFLISLVPGQKVIFNSTFESNKADKRGGAILCETTQFILQSSSSKSNSAEDGGFLFSSACKVTIDDSQRHIGNQATRGGAIYAQYKCITVMYRGSPLSKHMVDFHLNSAKQNGGALYLYSARIQLNQAKLNFTENTVTSAEGKGGAIYVLDTNCEFVNHQKCFVQNVNSINKYLVFENNRAVHGSVLYGGLLNRCSVSTISTKKESGIDHFKALSVHKLAPLAISSDPVTLCVCNEDAEPDCGKRHLNFTKMRGEYLDIPMVSLDQNSNSLDSVVNAHYREQTAQLDKGESRMEITKNCSSTRYHIFSETDLVTLVLQPEGLCERSPDTILTVHVELLPCRPGFQQINKTCTCDTRLRNLSVIECDIATQEIHHTGSMWLRYDKEYLQVHTNCPLDYCLVNSQIISLSFPDKQCANDHSGVLCGACQENHSIALGSSMCLPCRSARHNFLWLTVLFGLAGLALVALLLVCNLTISAGTLNGLIFYANVVSISGVTSLYNCSLHPFLSVFVAWVNLDLGIETCFYDGLDFYQKTWLQFCFPLYIWLLVGAIIVSSYYSSRASKLFGRNNIAILATLFLLSYNKLLKTIVTAFSVTEVLRASADNISDPLVPHMVWTYDGSVEYLRGRHVVLFVTALLLLLFLFLPYTLLLTFGQCVRSMPVRMGRCRWLTWVTHSTAFVSILDAYHAPYLKKHRYWTGLMLLTRCLLFIAFAISYSHGNVMVNMYITAMVILGILIIKTVTSTYKRFFLNALELCFLVNLEILSMTLSYLMGSGNVSSLCKFSNASISLSLVLFFLILAYHAYLQLQKGRCLARVTGVQLGELRQRWAEAVQGRADDVVPTKTTTLVELREELLESDISGHNKDN